MFVYSAFADEISADLSVQISELQKHGIGYIEARGINGKNISNHTASEAVEIKKILDDNNMKISALGSPIGKIKITDDFDAETEKFKRTVELAKIFDTKYIRIFSFYMDTSKAEKYRNEVFKRFQTYIDIAKENKIVLLHENEKQIYGDTPQRCLDLLKTINSDYLKATFDPANFIQCKADPLSAFELLENYIEYVHIKDALWQSGDVVPAGMGDGKVKEILTRLHQKKWNGFLSIEPHLGDFQGFADLEGGKTVKKESSGPDKFDIAFAAIESIINDIM